MDIFINSTYTGSMEGYRLLRMENGSFHEIDSPDDLNPAVYQFFSEDLFKALWVDLPYAYNSAPVNGFFGCKGITGTFNNGKSGVIDFAIYADDNELKALANLTQLCLSNYVEFCALLFKDICIENGTYIASADTLIEHIFALPQKKKLKFCNNPDGNYCSAEDVFHLAVCIGSTVRAAEQLSQMCCFAVNESKLIDEKHFMKSVWR